TRTDVPPYYRLLGDERFIYLVETDADNNSAVRTRAFRASDGGAVDVPEFSTIFQNRQRVLGRHLFLKEDDKVKVVLRLYDVHTAKDVWQQSYPAGSIVLRSEDPNLTGVVEPDGKVTVMDLRTQKEVLKVPAYDPKDPWKGIDPKQLGK